MEAMNRQQSAAGAEVGKMRHLYDDMRASLDEKKARPVKVGDIVTAGDRECRVRKITPKDYILRPLRAGESRL